MFSHTQLLGGVVYGVLTLYASIREEIIEIAAGIFTTLVVMEYANCMASEVLCPHLVTVEGTKDLRLLVDEVDSRVSQVIIDERDPVVVAMMAVHGQWTMHIQENA